MRSQPHVSIVIPTRERAALLEITLHSVLASVAEARQKGIETEVIVVDDASPSDSTRRLAERMGVGYDRIPVHSGRNNPAAAIARGIRLVNGRAYSFFGDDDVMLTRFIPLHYAALSAGADVCTGSYVMVDADLAKMRTVVLPPPDIADLLAGRITINDGAMVRTNLVADLAWEPELEQAIFYPIWLELLDRGHRFATLTEPTWLYRRHDGNVSSRKPPNDAELRRLVQDRFKNRILARDGVLPEPPPSAPAAPTAPAAAQARSQPTPSVGAPRPSRVMPWRRAIRRLRRGAGIRRRLARALRRGRT